MNFRIQEYINKDFFKEVRLYMVNYARDRPRAQHIIQYRRLINRHLNDYLAITNYQRPDFVYAQQSAIIKGTKIYTAYTNNVHLTFGQHLRRAVNALFNTRQRIVDLRRVLSAQGMDDDEIKHRIRQDTILPAQTFKQAISQQPINMEQLSQAPIYMEALEALQSVFDAYNEGYNVGEQRLYYDAKRNPANHFKAFYQLSRLFEHLGLSVFNCFPLRCSWFPHYVTIDSDVFDINHYNNSSILNTTDSNILCQNILEIRWPNAVDKLNYRGRVVDLDSKALKPQEGGQLRFRETIQTDGVGVTVLKKRLDKQTMYTARFTVEYEDTSYITNLTRRNHQEISGRCVAVDPGRRDMLYFVHEDSTPEQPDLDVVQAEQALSQQPSSTVSIEDFDHFLQARSEQSAVFSRFYGHTITNHDNGYPLFRKIRLSAYFNKQRAEQKLIQDLRAKFGEDAVFVMGNWSGLHARYHEPIRGLGFRRLLEKHVFQIFLIDEYKTSRRCPRCHNEILHTFRRVPNPQPYRRERYPTVACHGLLSCTNPYCRPVMTAPDRYRLWNRDASACLNYIHILRGLRRNGMVPDRSLRVAVAPTRRRRRVDDQEQPRTRIRLDDDSPS
ncbi:unnamed protein product [Rhizopus microsporus]